MIRPWVQSKPYAWPFTETITTSLLLFAICSSDVHDSSLSKADASVPVLSREYDEKPIELYGLL
jgi:hypothetical protein